ncbi:hypothetical protein [Corynebacterium comes]|uniref:Uncharacterized protein n=1 Tax=Corynebacterium comes TaxID=2675218 RepID=A0A6B8WCZ5_9CORY|nr:hypothetical protein [Corynebacterium comes]QGU04628.1 hypothetical protein CETAM_06835 [Corynebacterium comes]
MNIRAEVWSPLQNTAVWLGAWLHGLEATDNLVDALTDLGGEGLVGVLRDIRQVSGTALSGEEPVLRLVLSGPGEAPALRAGSEAAEATSESGLGALVLRDADPLTSHVLVPDRGGDWRWFVEEQPLPAPAWLSPGEADQLLTQATNEAARLVQASGYRTDVLSSPRLTVGTLADFYDTPGLPAAVPVRAAKLFARADRVAAIVETVTERMNDHRIDPQLLALWRHVRAARMAGVAYAVGEFGRLT